MKVIPVMDILNGIVVHAMMGEREKYKPIKSCICSNANPLKVASTFKKLGFKSLYIADLDAITGKKPNLQLLKRIAEKTGLKLMVDCGSFSYIQPEKIFEVGVEKVIIGTETLQSTKNLKHILEKFGWEKIVISLDAKNGKILTNASEILNLPVEIVAKKFLEIGFKKFIFLDLSRVGSEKGINFSLVEKLQKKLIHGFLIVGGGVKSLEDVYQLDRMGVYGVLVSTALHKGKIRKEDLINFL
ncbi:hypothetical protein CW703_00315 [Candidatus Bathyarchaeota archaeon]|nr:MAG: hypothetical protein CW703_00315 [Candidatus Bathyarchaeota archaeon]